ncbi:MAG: ubiquinol-cytochrome c reductase iron-sulfur subunit [Gammaproteobacteria bacterium]|nr:ubiquinol-cytochrome c reductase iron-sulfur subunit [Gammaproteobacteria bacterium]MBT8151388.1 ubiquinol-cytochrome c reductase iron-sulfur subunit [Gammaproteobacteria bacterium]NND38622.1 ubiquinol-cytochrome c reductase iron-sulfur subunit [Pseudomonadales bacterium]NNM12116.1 ubiquinol-cytochrome c reductase iron-sulfur subunit [Pseudomonadales bacterium]RZV55217.1 MAG: ubiquinol-cytochrome c reductase iron-sulfur subunit [Pseudomonadales bacterium]
MSSNVTNADRRRFLTTATSLVGVAGVVGVAVPFVGSWNPSARAKAAGAPVKFDFSKVEPGQMVRVEWRGKPVFVVRRTAEQLEALPSLNDKLKDADSANADQQPSYVDPQKRAIKDELLVLVGLCTHLGCSPKYITKLDSAAPDPDWEGGFFCACHGSRFDLAGRVYKGSPASDNLLVPPYSYITDSVLIIGVDEETA